MSNEDNTKLLDIANQMWFTYEAVFDKSVKLLSKRYKTKISIDFSKKESFERAFCERYNFVKSTYMNNDVEQLDRHKISAIAIIEFIRAKLLVTAPEISPEEEDPYIAEHLIALQTGLTHMHQMFNNLTLYCVGKNVKDWHWPISISCPKNHFMAIMARHLYFTEQRYSAEEPYKTTFNELDLAEKLFLLEWITLKAEGIDHEEIINKLKNFER